MKGPRLELDALRETWQSTPAPDAGELSRLRRDVAAQTRRLYLTVAAETTGALLGAVFFFYLAGSTHGAAAIAYGALGLATLAYQGWALRMRRDLWRARAATPTEYLRLQLRRSEARTRIAAASLFAGPREEGRGGDPRTCLRAPELQAQIFRRCRGAGPPEVATHAQRPTLIGQGGEAQRTVGDRGGSMGAACQIEEEHRAEQGARGLGGDGEIEPSGLCCHVAAQTGQFAGVRCRSALPSLTQCVEFESRSFHGAPMRAASASRARVRRTAVAPSEMPRVAAMSAFEKSSR